MRDNLKGDIAAGRRTVTFVVMIESPDAAMSCYSGRAAPRWAPSHGGEAVSTIPQIVRKGGVGARQTVVDGLQAVLLAERGDGDVQLVHDDQSRVVINQACGTTPPISAMSRHRL